MVKMYVVLKNRIEVIPFHSLWAAELKMRDFEKCSDVVMIRIEQN